ncbi:GIY-YIG nuclease family protein [Neobacillus sp. MER 74]|uniref:GIY-YIG nuclease family protein n=1 Tax=Neobacillus sp. MER 74 TaxID=2939566 RepID=UPI00203D7131|nr:GIY-YIG nuclease family protein [Neobacillus sp. MER 74]MCM3115701.1 GIY-YIG nuclease family protein [Neobacillus sp. MER 74]
MKNNCWHIDNISSKKLPCKPGIYLLHDEDSGVVYVGGTKNIRSRISTHRSLLRKKKHTNEQLQKAYDDGELTVNVLVVLSAQEKSEKIREIEGYFIRSIPALFATDSINLRYSE